MLIDESDSSLNVPYNRPNSLEELDAETLALYADLPEEMMGKRNKVPEQRKDLFDDGIQLLKKLGIASDRMASMDHTAISSLGDTLLNVTSFNHGLFNELRTIKSDFLMDDFLHLLEEDLQQALADDARQEEARSAQGLAHPDGEKPRLRRPFASIIQEGIVAEFLHIPSLTAPSSIGDVIHEGIVAGLSEEIPEKEQ